MEGDILLKETSSDYSYPHIDLEEAEVKMEAVELIPYETAERYSIFPFDFTLDKISIASTKALNIDVIEDIKFMTQKDITLYSTSTEQIERAIEVFYKKNQAEKVLEAIRLEQKDAIEIQEIRGLRHLEDAPIVRLVNYIISEAVAKRASDIHIEPYKETVLLRFRIDGILNQIMELPIEIYPNLVARIKVMSKMDIIEKRTPQDGKFELLLRGKAFDFRVSTIPVIFGEKLVVRILYKGMSLAKLNKIFSEDTLNKICEIIKLNHGIILITGPTGSGKSTTLYAILNELNNNEKNIITIEDPVEYMIQGINQINVNNKSGLSFARGLRSILRQDPDIIMVGEIRDEETAQIAVRSAITGHLVLSTLHTNDSFSAVMRLVDMGVPKYLVSDALVGVLAQRLVRVLCPYCKTPKYVSTGEANKLGIKCGEKIYTAAGCPRCNNSGYKGRVVISEILKVDSEIRNIITHSDDTEDIKNYNMNIGMSTLRQSCMELVREGVTTLEEYDRISFLNY